MKNKNSGFTLVELIVTISIILILAGITIFGIGTVVGFKTNACAERIYGYMNETKTNTLGKDDVSMEISFISGDYKVSIGTSVYTFSADPTTGKEIKTIDVASSQVSTYQVGDGSLDISAVLDDGSSYDLKTNKIIIRFDRASGAFKNSEIYDNAGLEVIGQGDNKKLKELVISHNGKSRKIKCVPFTGKFSLE